MFSGESVGLGTSPVQEPPHKFMTPCRTEKVDFSKKKQKQKQKQNHQKNKSTGINIKKLEKKQKKQKKQKKNKKNIKTKSKLRKMQVLIFF